MAEGGTQVAVLNNVQNNTKAPVVYQNQGDAPSSSAAANKNYKT